MALRKITNIYIKIQGFPEPENRGNPAIFLTPKPGFVATRNSSFREWKVISYYMLDWAIPAYFDLSCAHLIVSDTRVRAETRKTTNHKIDVTW